MLHKHDATTSFNDSTKRSLHKISIYIVVEMIAREKKEMGVVSIEVKTDVNVSKMNNRLAEHCEVNLYDSIWPFNLSIICM